MKQMKMWSVSKNPVKILVQQLELFWLSKHGSVSVLLMSWHIHVYEVCV